VHPTRFERVTFAFGEHESQGHHNQGANWSNGHGIGGCMSAIEPTVAPTAPRRYSALGKFSYSAIAEITIGALRA